MITDLLKNAVITFYPHNTLHSKTLMAIFEGDPSGSPNKNYMAVICN